jgi:ABC-type branched-subunit amino acid transport system substrate-binding protein
LSYERLIETHATGPTAPVAKLELAKLLLQEGRLDEAQELFDELALHLDPQIAEQASLHLGVVMHRRGNHRAAIEILLRYWQRPMDSPTSLLVLQSLAASAALTGDFVTALLSLDLLLSAHLAPATEEAIRQEADQHIRDRADQASLRVLYERLPHRGVIWPRVARHLALLSANRGDTAHAQEIIRGMQDAGQILDPELATLLALPQHIERAPIGVILPLEGRGAEVGRHMLQGFRLANEGASDLPELRLVLRDDGGDPEQAADAVDELVDEHQVIAILGPVGLRSTRAAAARASHHGVPLIVFHPSGTLGAEDAAVFRYYATPEAEAEALVNRAAQSNVSRVAVLAPDNGFGRAMSAAFTRAASAANMTVAAQVSYPPGTTAFGEFVEILEEAEWDALFIPDAWRSLSFSVPTLAAAGLWSATADAPPTTGRQHYLLLAPSVSFSEELVSRAQRYLQGASFALAFHASSIAGASRDFYDRYQSRFTTSPDVHAAYAFDALSLLRLALRTNEPSSEAIIDALSQSIRLEIPLSLGGGFDESREALEPPAVWELRDDRLVPPSSDENTSAEE